MTDSEIPSARPATNTRLLFALLLVGQIIVFAIALAALVRTYQAPPQHDQNGTWMCVTSTGQQTAVVNPGNCGPNDEVLWCETWQTTPSGDGKCVG